MKSLGLSEQATHATSGARPCSGSWWSFFALAAVAFASAALASAALASAALASAALGAAFGALDSSSCHAGLGEIRRDARDQARGERDAARSREGGEVPYLACSASHRKGQR